MANRFLNNITINDEYTLPSADGTNGQAIVTDGAGNLSFGTVAAGTADDALKITLTVKNVSSAQNSLSPGTLVRVAPTASPPAGNVLEVDIADNSSASTMPAIGIITETIAYEAEGDCVAFGRASGFSTSGFSQGDTLYVGTSGAFTTTKPTGSNLIQRIGQVIKVDSSNGSIEVFGAGRANDVPNIPQDQLWLGNSSGVATATSHTVENISNVTTSTKTDGQALVWDETNNYWKNGDVAAAGGGGGGSMSTEIDQHTGNGTTDAFSLTTASTDADAVQVYLDGVYQVKTAANYSVSGSTVTFVDPPTLGTAIEFVHFINTAASSLTNKIFTGDGTKSDFDLVDTVSDENYTFVFIQGIYQEKSAYSISGSTITFSSPPTSGYSIEVMIFGTVSISGNGGISWVTPKKTGNFTAVASEGYFVDTTSAAITVTLPSSPTAGDEVSIVDYAGTAATNNITITSSGNINGSSDDVVINYERGGVSIVYVDATQGWIAYSAANETATALGSILPSSFSVDYLVVAGGGGGGAAGAGSGGGGAGGLRTSYGSTSGGGASAETSLSLSTATNYTVTVGPGGAGGTGTGYGNHGTQGNNSVFSTITASGGGYGSAGNVTGGSGGSGGGGNGGYSTAGGTAISSPVQGYAGGNAINGANPERYAAGGGGGAFAAGSNGSCPGTSELGGDGGDGLEVNIIGGTGNYYAGGGGGGTYDFNVTGTPGSGGSGGGGNAGSASAAGSNGTNNTGGGGGGGAGHGTGAAGGSGGSGVVILRYPGGYTVTIGAGLTGTTATDGSDKVTTFTAGTGNISFS